MYLCTLILTTMVPRLLSLLLLLSLATSSLTVVATNNYEVYIDRFCHLAVEHQEEFGIPAAITQAQGLLESAAGKSTLATQGNNHFGIKCHMDWKGK